MRLEHKPASAGGFANNLHGFEALRDFFASATLTSLIDFPFVIIFLAAIWYLAGGLVVVPLTAIPLILLASYCIEIPARRANEETYFGNTQKQALAIEILNGLETIKSNSAEGRLLAKWEKYVSMIGRSSTRAKFFSLLAANVTNCIMQLNYVALVVVGTYMIMAGDLTLGSLIACSILSGRGLAPLGQIASVASRYHNTKLALAGLDKLMNIPVERDRGKHYVHRPKLSGDIEFKEISFCYPNQKMEALEQVSFTIKARERVAILGRNGSGKSTILKLIAGLYQPLHGHIRVDGTDIAQMDPAELRHNIGYVSQDVLLFYGNMRDNIIMSAPWADDAAILNACQLSGVDNFVKRHPLGYDMRIGERGEGISGGQRQAVGIARTLLPNPPILLFDEPSASMDNSSEQEFIRNLSTIIADKTLILVTHKPQMLSLVNRVIVIDNAHIVADGPKDHILNALSQNKIKAVDS